MKITRITKTKQGRYALFDESDAFLFSLDDETLVRSGVRAGVQLSEDALEELRTQSDARKARSKAMDYLSMRDYAEGELYEKLRQKFDDHAAAYAVAEMQRMGFLDDIHYARNRAASLARKNKSNREIARQLREKGIDRDTIDAVLAELDAPQDDACYELIQKSYLRKLQAGERDKVVAALARRGFAYGAIRNALARCRAEEEYTNDYDFEYAEE